jgi:hypothetical protein
MGVLKKPGSDMMTLFSGLARAALLLILPVAPALAGPAINQFETKDLESSPGDLQFQSQNAIAFNQPRRKIRQTEPGEFVYDDNSIARERYALEMQMGITSWFRARLGVEFEKERLDDPSSPARANAFEDLHLTGIALEGVFVLIPVKTSGIGLGLLTEYDSSVRGGLNQFYIGPIIQAVNGPWSALANLLLVQNYGKPDRQGLLPNDKKRDFAYALQVQYEASQTWALAVEAYGTFDRFDGSGTPPPDQVPFGRVDQHRAGPVVYYRFNKDGGSTAPAKGKQGLAALRKDDDAPGAAAGDNDDGKKGQVSIGVGLLFGLNDNTPRETLKLSLEYNF